MGKIGERDLLVVNDCSGKTGVFTTCVWSDDTTVCSAVCRNHSLKFVSYTNILKILQIIAGRNDSTFILRPELLQYLNITKTLHKRKLKTNIHRNVHPENIKKNISKLNSETH